MAITCPQCTNTNPQGAKYCFFDGYSLSSAAQEGPVDPGSRPFSHPFVFPSGSSCGNFDQLAQGCQQNWDAAKELLQSGAFASFLGGMGRADLAMAAKEAVQFPDLDRALDQFITRLPSQAVPGPKLRVEPVEVRLDPPGTAWAVGKDSSFTVDVRNLGSRLLYGSVAADSAWLQPGEPTDTGPKLFKFSASGQVKISVKGQHLRAGSNTLEGKLIFESSGGGAEVVVKVDVPATPFKEGVLAGAITPRQLAEKALKAAKDAAPLFENGAVAAWYKANGWAYPVPGPVASGLGAVQQFFEALGLTKPPRLQLRDQEVKLAGAPGATLRHVLQITTADNKPIFVHASTNQPWLTADRVQVKGAAANVAIDVRAVPDQPGALLSARVIVTGNGNQRFDIPVSLQVAGVAPVGGDGEKRKAEGEKGRTGEGEKGRSADGDTGRRSKAKPEAVVAATAALPASHSPPQHSPSTSEADHDTAVSHVKTKPIVGAARPASANPFADLDEPAAPPRKKTSQAPDEFTSDAEEDDLGSIVVSRYAPKKKPSQPRNKSFLHLIPLGLLFLALGGIFIADLFGPGPRHDALTESRFKIEVSEATEEVLPFKAVDFYIADDPNENDKGGPVKVNITATDADGIPIDQDPLISFQINETKTELKSFGLATTKAYGAVKKLNYAEDGSTNSTLVSIDGVESRFGNGTTGRRRFAYAEGKEPPKNPLFSTEIWANYKEVKDKQGKTVGRANIFFTQILEIVPSKQPTIVNGKKRRQLDTVLVRYVILNKDDVPHKVGMRFQVDTFIGGNDGVPFTVPGSKELVTTSADFKDPKDVPDFLQALEFPDLQKPGTIAHMTLKVGGKLEPPSRVSLTHWPKNDLSSWNVPIEPIRGPAEKEGDSAVVLYWPEKELKPGEKRYIGYAYGLGTVTSEEKSDSSLALTLGGSFEPGQTFTITAYARNPPNQTLTLELPAGLEKLSGDNVVAVPPSKANQTSVVTWKAKVLRTGEFPIRVKSNTGVTQTKTINIAPAQALAGTFNITLVPPFEPGAVCQINAQVSEPVAGQTLTLNLPKDMESVGKVLTKKVPADGLVSWKVKILDAGIFPVKVVSSTGMTQGKTINIFRQVLGGQFNFDLQPPDFSPGKTFQVIAKVPIPVAEQKLRLELPKGLETKDPLIKPVPLPANSTVSWSVKILEPGAFPIRVSSAAFAIKKTLTVDPPGSGAFNWNFAGTIAPGKEFDVVAKVQQAARNQKLTLVLPAGIKLVSPAETISVPPADKNGVSTVTWRIRLEKAGGVLPVKVESTTGQAKVRIIKSTIF